MGGIREYVQIHHNIVIELARRGIVSSICYNNKKAKILAILEEKSIRDYFIFPSISWEPKGMRLARLIETVQLCRRQIAFVFLDARMSSRTSGGKNFYLLPRYELRNPVFYRKVE